MLTPSSDGKQLAMQLGVAAYLDGHSGGVSCGCGELRNGALTDVLVSSPIHSDLLSTSPGTTISSSGLLMISVRPVRALDCPHVMSL